VIENDILDNEDMAKDAFEVIPGVGPSIAADLHSLGFRDVDELKNQDPERMY